ncbi:calcium-binding protein [Arenibaculum pallidiluteum]|uniref:calcium-binding protein n=1 Tax=Arenibaculum pallidiluteum TaxID=2812559 RepID=UPI001A95FAF7|nr:calcium-binding protein [Arenibaculum pallidiluteum]
MALPTEIEQYIVELVNRARLDPVGEARRVGIPTDDPRWPIADAPVAPLAVDGRLVDAMRARAERNVQGDWDSYRSGMDRALEAGYGFAPGGSAADTMTQSISYRDPTRDFDLFWSATYGSDWSRSVFLDPAAREIGVGHKWAILSNGTPANATATITAWDGRPQYFLTGVVYADAVIRDARYSLGEGQGGIAVTLASGDGAVDSGTTRAAGGYDMALGGGRTLVTFSGGGLPQPVEVLVTAAGTNVKLDLLDGTRIASSADATLGAGAVDLVLLGAVGASGRGNDAANSLTGSSGADRLDGAGGDDWLTGGAGADAFVFARGAGNDVITDFSATGAARDKLVLAGFGVTDFAALRAAIRQDGADTVIALGTQTLRLARLDAGLLDAGLVVFNGGPGLPPPGGEPERRFYGTAESERIVGTVRNDLIDAKGGVDVMVGGFGDDTYVVDSKYGDGVVELPGQGIDTVISWASRYRLAANVENLALRGGYRSSGTGNALDNRISGSEAANTLEGGLGDDYLTGGGGSDTFVVVRGYGSDTIGDFGAGDVVRLFDTDLRSGAEAVAALRTQGGNAVLDLGAGQSVTLLGRRPEDLRPDDFVIVNARPAGMPAPFALPESELPQNALYARDRSTDAENWSGGPGNDLMDPKGGIDTMAGGAGDDTYVVDSKLGDRVIERPAEGTDTVVCWGSRYALADEVENLILKGEYRHTVTGNGLDNLIRIAAGSGTVDAGAGNDIIEAGRGADLLTGGAGRDIFVWKNADLDAGPDKVMDFRRGEDMLDLRGLFAAIGYDGFDPVGDRRMRIDDGGGWTRLAVDMDGSGMAWREVVHLAGVTRTELHVTSSGFLV